MKTLSYLVYTSTATKPFDTEELFRLLKRSRAANEQRDVTGGVDLQKWGFCADDRRL